MKCLFSVQIHKSLSEKAKFNQQKDQISQIWLLKIKIRLNGLEKPKILPLE